MTNSLDPAHILFAGDAPASSTSSDRSATSQNAAPIPAAPSPAPAAEEGPDAAEVLFGNAAQGDNEAAYEGAFEKLDDLARALTLDGQAERAAQLSNATDVMFEDAIAHGTPPETMQAITGFLHEAAGTMGEISPDALADGQARGLAELAEAGVSDADLAIARSMVKAMEARIPNLSWQLEKSGLGNNVDFCKLLIAEGKRRSGRR